MSDDLPGNSSEAEAEAAATARRIVTICNQKGLHARAAARFVKASYQFDADIWVRKNGTVVSGRSIMGLMMLAAGPGTSVTVSALGPDAEQAITAITELVDSKFNEEGT